MRHVARILLTTLFMGSSGIVAAQERPPTFTEEVEVRVMDLDVAVTDKAGRPVPGLTRDDFTVRIGGRVVPIDYFARVDEGTIHAPDLATASPDQVLAAYRRGTEAYVPRHFLMYVDLGHLAPDARKRGLEGLRDLVTRMGPNDMARVLMFDRRSKELTEWTNSKEQLFAALTKIEKAGVGMSRLLTERQTLRDIDFTRRRSEREFMARNYAEQERAEVRQMLNDVGSELATLSPLAGKKAFLFVSGGFEFQPGYAMASYALGQMSLLALDTRNMGPELEQIVRRANASEITFYTVDARGLEGGGVSASNDDPLMSRPSVSFLARQDSQEGMMLLARETGGLALLNSNDLRQGLSRIYQDASVYYSIGVTLTKLPPAAYQDVRVEVNRPGVVVRTRRGYAARTEADRARDRVQATLKTNLAYGAIPMTLRTAPATKQGGKFTVPISVTLPASALTFVPDGGGRRATADVSIGVMDDAGRMSDVAQQEATFTLPEGKENEPLVYTATLQTRKGNQRIVVNLRDRASGKMGTAKADVRIE
ncbi:MAG TPA: VWA domain-containing protein [Thermoanaerobaculia bacterium]|nr:VWA domain-containing protein [Thermoanaerobaculia bacterium]HEV8609566.1 VWA domain-containing protein [Thermoanaerobaculia bacterium]